MHADSPLDKQMLKKKCIIKTPFHSIPAKITQDSPCVAVISEGLPWVVLLAIHSTHWYGEEVVNSIIARVIALSRSNSRTCTVWLFSRPCSFREGLAVRDVNTPATSGGGPELNWCKVPISRALGHVGTNA